MTHEDDSDRLGPCRVCKEWRPGCWDAPGRLCCECALEPQCKVCGSACGVEDACAGCHEFVCDGCRDREVFGLRNDASVHWYVEHNQYLYDNRMRLVRGDGKQSRYSRLKSSDIRR